MAGGIVLFAGHDTAGDQRPRRARARRRDRAPTGGTDVHDRPRRGSGLGGHRLGAVGVRPAHAEGGRLVERAGGERRDLRRGPGSPVRGDRERRAADAGRGHRWTGSTRARSTRSSRPSWSRRSTVRSRAWRRSRTGSTSPPSSPATRSRSSTRTRASRRGGRSSPAQSTWRLPAAATRSWRRPRTSTTPRPWPPSSPRSSAAMPRPTRPASATSSRTRWSSRRSRPATPGRPSSPRSTTDG